MEETVYTPIEFFNLPDYLQRKILIEELDFGSINNLCSAVRREERKSPGATKFFRDFCENAQFWKDKFRYKFPRSYTNFERVAAMEGREDRYSYWKVGYLKYERLMPGWEVDLIENSERGDLKRVQELLERGVDPDVRNKYGETALMQVSFRLDRRADVSVAELLIAAGADVNARNVSGNTALMFASVEGNAEVAELLLDAGADVNARNVSGDTALIDAAGEYRYEIMELLMDAGADVNVRNASGTTALIWASAGNKLEIVDKLLDLGADVSVRDERYTPLFAALDWRREGIVNRLLYAGADVNSQDAEGNTALMYIMNRLTIDLGDPEEYDEDTADVIDDYLPTIFTVIKHNPDPDIPNYKGETAVEIAERLGLDGVVDALMYLRREKEAL